MKIILIRKYEKETMMGEGIYSVEAGFADNIQHFDHHGEFCKFPAPCNNGVTRKIGSDSVIYVTHIDADTLVGLQRLTGVELPEGVDFSLMEKIDLNGSSVCKDKFDQTLLFMVGVGQMSRTLGIPRATDEPQDITSLVMELINTPSEDVIQIGRKATEQSEATYQNCLVEKQGNVAFFSIGENDPLDPSRPYEDGQTIVVVHRDHYKSISVYCAPSTDYAFAGKSLAGIEFQGHPKACGSPRGLAFSKADALQVFKSIVDSIA